MISLTIFNYLKTENSVSNHVVPIKTISMVKEELALGVGQWDMSVNSLKLKTRQRMGGIPSKGEGSKLTLTKVL